MLAYDLINNALEPGLFFRRRLEILSVLQDALLGGRETLPDHCGINKRAGRCFGNWTGFSFFFGVRRR